MRSSLPHITNYATCLSLSPYILLPLLCAQYEPETVVNTERINTTAWRFMWHLMQMKSGLICMAGVTLLQPELQKLDATALVKCARLKAADNEGVWHRNLGSPPLSACPPPVWRDKFVHFSRCLFLVLSANSIHQAIRVVEEFGGRRPTQPPAKEQTTSSSGRSSWTQNHKLHPKSSMARENWFLSCTRSVLH